MSPLDYGIGGTERPTDASEAFADLPQNKTLFIQQLTQDAPMKPEVVKGLKSVNEVFEHYRPNADIELKGEEGEEIKENLKFSNVGDFGPKGITKQSEFLQNLQQKKAEMSTLVKQLRSNKVLNSALQEADSKEAFIDSLRQLVKELEENK
ncbi:MAG: type VI secretion system contractile sheath small subunit [Cryomorphaceae bacterium]|nr:type VI secretion system contractile sheath small subunit [Flavobacteriales bacterium]